MLGGVLTEDLLFDLGEETRLDVHTGLHTHLVRHFLFVVAGVDTILHTLEESIHIGRVRTGLHEVAFDHFGRGGLRHTEGIRDGVVVVRQANRRFFVLFTSARGEESHGHEECTEDKFIHCVVFVSMSWEIYLPSIPISSTSKMSAA